MAAGPFVAFRYARLNAQQHFYILPAVRQLRLLRGRDGDGTEPGTLLLPTPLGLTLSAALAGLPPLHLAFARASPACPGVCELPFRPALLDRSPSSDYDDFGLPARELPMFCFPHGVRLVRAAGSDAPLPTVSSFVFTSASGAHIYVACLTFWEAAPPALLRQLEAKLASLQAWLPAAQRPKSSEPKLPRSRSPRRRRERQAARAAPGRKI